MLSLIKISNWKLILKKFSLLMYIVVYMHLHDHIISALCCFYRYRRQAALCYRIPACSWSSRSDLLCPYSTGCCSSALWIFLHVQHRISSRSCRNTRVHSTVCSFLRPSDFKYLFSVVFSFHFSAFCFAPATVHFRLLLTIKCPANVYQTSNRQQCSIATIDNIKLELLNYNDIMDRSRINFW